MIQPHDPPKVSRMVARGGPWRRVGSVMAFTVNVAIISLGLKSFVGTATDASLYTVWAPLAIVLGIAATWAVRGILKRATRPDPCVELRACGRCGRVPLRALTRVGPGRESSWTGARCVHCGMTYRRVDGRIVADPPALATGSADDPGIRFDDEKLGPDEVRFLDNDPD